MGKAIRKPTTMLYPLPAVLVSCGTGEQANIITLAWVGTVCSEPPMVGISVRPERHSYKMIRDLGEFVVNLASAEQARWVDLCGVASGRRKDKWAACGFTPTPASQVQPPLIAQCPVNLECRVRERLPLGTHDLFIGEVVAVHVDESLLDDRGQVEIARLTPFVFFDSAYWRVGERLGGVGFSRPSSAREEE